MSGAHKQADNPLLGLTFQFQPILAADGRRLLAYETLARRTRRDGTIEGPAAILPRLLAPQRIVEFTRHSLEFALARLHADPYLAALSVNLSPCQIELPDVHRILAQTPAAVRGRLLIELTEDPIAGHPALPTVLESIATLGVRILLDDIAPGSRRRFLALRHAVHGLKLDRSILPAFAADRLPRAARRLLDIAADNGLLLIAEGIEDLDDLPRMASRGIAYFQGFALGEPWSDTQIARRRIVEPRSGAMVPDTELLPGYVTALISKN